MNLAPRLMLAIALSAGLAGCGSSAPLRYHSLAVSADPAPATQQSAEILVEVLPVAVPERVNRDELVLIGDKGGLEVRSDERWAAPLSDEIRQMVDDALWRRLRAADMYFAPVAPTGSPLPQYRLALRIERLDAVPGRHAVAEASWTFRPLPQGPSTVCRATAVEPLSGRSSDEAVAALRAGASRLTRTVAASLDRLRQGAPDPCRGDGDG